ncbi:MAG: nicotinate phosphoribosyltransferase [Bacteroidetes bacterium HGW-Bacteroidetes-11]|jgi:nicotinate phosphoribosyltransferase|nr:MAG: nicotinate phosphoribosyltransferase [Bacteroidetes bacterium HGW-Bacteroidetes-11]
MENSFNISYCSDKYQYTMGKTYFESGLKDKRAIFNLFYRTAPDKNNWAVVSGIDEALKMISGLGSESESFFEKFLPGEEYREYRKFLSKMKFTGNIYAMREGEIAFPTQPVIIVEGPLIESQVLETPLLCIMNHQMAIATKASRVSRSTIKPVSEFGSRRAHGPWAAVYGAKAAYIGGCLNTSNILTSTIFNIPATGTMAHSYITAFGCTIAGELMAFETYIINHFGEPLVLLIDTYDTLRCGLPNAIKAFKSKNVNNEYPASFGIRLDSGDLTYLSNKCREELDKAGLENCKIFATNSLDEYIIAELERQGAKIDAYGVGDAIATSKHNPCFGNVYKLVEIEGQGVLKRSEDKSKAINPGFQITYRIIKHGMFKADVTCLRGDSMSLQIENSESFTIRDEFDDTKITFFEKSTYEFKTLQSKVMENGKNCNKIYTTQQKRDYYLSNLHSLNETQRRLINPHFYKVDISDDLYDLKNSLIDSLIKEIKEYYESERK